MRLSLRVGSAAALIIVTLFLFSRRLTTEQTPKSFWRFDTTSFRAALRPQPAQDVRGRKWGAGTGNSAVLTFQTTPIEIPNEGIIVMGKLREEDTAWVSAELAEWRNFVYTVDDTSAPAHTPKNKGREALPYLQYIVDHYDDLPAIIIFLHSHRDGWPAGWHTDTMDYSNVDSVRALQRDYVLAEGFVSLRCQLSPGCPAEMQPFRKPPKPGNTGEKHYAEAWKVLFGNDNVPQEIGAPCCSQFAVSRDQVLQRPLSDYKRMYNWVLNNDLPDEVTSNIMEYSWHIIFGKEPVFCPDTFQCYADVYGEEVII
ncbi:uncharacterized protein N7496_005518 [Penicillium cataractarum]|uniref:Uncharacterized protein n=1 Tax=Penicillium cataractarum TaxID=2100454 RepID=A0A9W9SIW9_9EURO|nr:uncharacterized protein N7496_005518 [Penicillium cataractarum]KAJ5378109.1 hypothetical protein N7496_005518 [Penicillium cataractarum]